MTIRISCLIFSAGLAASLAIAIPASADPPAAEFRNGHWVEIAPPAPVVPATDAQLDHMQQLLENKDASAALTVGINWVKSHGKTAPQRDRCLLLIAQAKYQIPSSDNRLSSFYYLDELMDEYPESKLFYPALELQYKIADAYLNGYKDFFLGLAIIGQDGRAEEMLYRIQQRSPGSPLAEKALLRTCDYYYATGEYELAHDSYAFYAKNYPRSSMVPQVKLRQAFSSLAQFRGVRFDPTCLIDARAELSDIVAAYPEMAREQNIKPLISRIDVALARKLLVTADYYRRTKAFTGAVYVYRYLIDTYPNTSDAVAAQKALDQIPKKVLEQAPPRPASKFVLPEGPPLPGKGP